MDSEPDAPSPARKPRSPRPQASAATGSTGRSTASSASTAAAKQASTTTRKAPATRAPAKTSATKAPAAPAATPAETAAETSTTAAPVKKAPPRKAPARRPTKSAPLEQETPREIVLSLEGLIKRFGDTTAVAGVDLAIDAGSFYGIVGPNGAGKTTMLSMVTGLLRPDGGHVHVHGADVWSDPVVAKRNMGVLPDRLRLFDRLTGSQLLYYAGTLRGLNRSTVVSRTADLAEAFGLEDALDRLVTDYSAGMTKKIALAAAMIHSPRLLVLDEPFESVDPVSAANITEILRRYVAAGGTVVLSSHSMDLIQRICDHVAVVVNGAILDSGTVDEVRRGKSLEERFVELAGGSRIAEGMEWLHSFSD